MPTYCNLNDVIREKAKEGEEGKLLSLVYAPLSQWLVNAFLDGDLMINIR
jgi:hypothetical protein